MIYLLLLSSVFFNLNNSFSGQVVNSVEEELHLSVQSIDSIPSSFDLLIKVDDHVVDRQYELRTPFELTHLVDDLSSRITFLISSSSGELKAHFQKFYFAEPQSSVSGSYRVIVFERSDRGVGVWGL